MIIRLADDRDKPWNFQAQAQSDDDGQVMVIHSLPQRPSKSLAVLSTALVQIWIWHLGTSDFGWDIFGLECGLVNLTFSNPYEHNTMAEMVASEIVMLRECCGKRRAPLTPETSRGCAALRRRPRWQSAVSPAARSRTSRAAFMSPSARTVTMPGLGIIPGWPDCSSKVMVLYKLEAKN